MFRVLSDIHLGPGSVRIIPITQCTKKQDPFGIYVGFGSVRIHFHRIGFGSDFRVRCLKNHYLIDVTEIFNLLDWETKKRLFKLAYMILTLFLTIFWLIYSTVDDYEE
ncbi:hypothetical protein IGI04_030105 [Brassica rapa subsp. trilocularis]|uniref:Uncharacterized protein n=1 Tax=Brassica rapa subsp. trilocularis TaxID=1813537 RepID=A0ABQ7LPQ8_BRACM|nr:hypothetical protein IGI04_030105 [Brassica rapa subsp. trilocularis]